MADPAMAAFTVEQILEAAGLTVIVGYPAARPRGGFVTVFLLSGVDMVERGVTVSQVLELEAWSPRSLAALQMATTALEAILAVARDREKAQELGIRDARIENHVAELPTGEAAWNRYRFTVALSFRQTRERIL